MHPRLRIWLRRTAVALFALVVLLVLVWVFRFPLFGGLIREAVTDGLSSAGFEASYGELSGSLLGDFTLTAFEISDSPGLPALKTAKVGRVHARYSLLGLLLGRDRWISEVAVDDITVVLDLNAPPPPETEPGPDSGPLEIDLVPARVRLSGIDLDVTMGAQRFALTGGRIGADAGDSDSLAGDFGAESVRLRLEGREHVATGAAGEFDFRGGVATVRSVTAGERRFALPVIVDISRLDREELDVRLDFPLFGGTLFADLKAAPGAEYPAVEATIRLLEIDPAPFLAFLPDLPAGADLVSIDLSIVTDGEVEPDLGNLAARFELAIAEPVYAGYRMRGITAAGTLGQGRLAAKGELVDPPGSFEIEADLAGDGPLSGSLRLSGLDLHRLRIDVDGRVASGMAGLKATVGGTIGSPTFSAKGALTFPALGEFGADSIEFAARGDLDLMTVQQFVVTRGPDRIRATGTLCPSARPIAFTGEVHVDIADVGACREFLPGELPEDLAGRLVLDITADGTSDEPGATVTAVLTGAGAEGFFTDSIELTALAPTSARFVVQSLRLKGRGDVPDLDIRDASIGIGEEGVAIDAPRIAVTRESLGLLATLAAGLRPSGEMTAELSIDSLDVGAVANRLGLDLGISGSLAGTISATGTPENPRAVIDLAVREPRSELPDLPAFTARAAELKASFENDLITLTKLLVEGERFTITADGVLPFSLDDPEAVAAAPVRGDVRIITLPLDLAGPLPEVGVLDGSVSAELSISGRADDPRVSGELRVKVDRVAVPGLEGLPVTGILVALRPENLGAKGGRVGIEEFRLEAAGALLSAHGSVSHVRGEPADPRLDLEITAIDIARVRAALGVDLPVEGAATFSLTVAPGPVVGVSLGVRELALPDNPGMTLDLGGEWRDGTFTFRDCRLVNQGKGAVISGRVPFHLSFAPFAAGPSPDREMDVAVTVTGLDLATLDLRSEGIRLGGSVDAGIAVGGVLCDPMITGALTLAGVRFRAEGAPGIDKLTGKIAFDREAVKIEELAGTLGRGPFRVTGSVAIANGRPGAADLRIVATNAQLMRSEGMRLRTDLDLTVTGAGPGDLTVGGTATIRSLKVGSTGLLAAQDIETVLAGLRSSPSLATLPLTTDPALKDVRLDVTLLIPEGAVHVRTNLVKATANGKLLVGGTIAIPRPRGRIYVPHGTVYLIAGRLELDHPIVTFKESDPLVPFIDGRATARVSGVDVYVNVSGPAHRARIQFSSVPPYPEPDIVSLILTGATRADLGSDALSGMASSYLLRQLSSSFSDDAEEDSAVSDLLSRIDVEFDDRKTGSGGIPGFTATARIFEWLFLRGQQESALDYGFDLIFRLTFP